MRNRRAGLAGLLFVALAGPASAQSTADDEGHAWWQHAVFYEIYPRSFADTNNDGIGDLPGITAKLDYLHWYGSGCHLDRTHVSFSQGGLGYDVSDYYNVDPDYGTLKDMDDFLAQGKQHHIRVLLDFVLTYTSDQKQMVSGVKVFANADNLLVARWERPGSSTLEHRALHGHHYSRASRNPSSLVSHSRRSRHD